MTLASANGHVDTTDFRILVGLMLGIEHIVVVVVVVDTYRLRYGMFTILLIIPTERYSVTSRNKDKQGIGYDRSAP